MMVQTMQANTNLPKPSKSFHEALTRRGLNTPEAANYLGVSEALLRKDRTSRSPQIPFSKICGRVVYFTDRLDDFISRHEVGVAA